MGKGIRPLTEDDAKSLTREIKLLQSLESCKVRNEWKEEKL
jgi:hypothetical protein